MGCGCTLEIVYLCVCCVCTCVCVGVCGCYRNPGTRLGHQPSLCATRRVPPGDKAPKNVLLATALMATKNCW